VFWRRRRDTEVRPAKPSPKRRFTDTLGDPASILAEAIRLTGEISGFDSLAVDGSFEGNIAVRGYCLVSDRGRVSGRISAHHVVISGRMDGKISARQRVELRSTAQVRADINAESVAIADGAFFDGRIHMRSESGRTSFVEKRRTVKPEDAKERKS
jgi:cytoskeletal protein CcmA (bactofilin family)